MLVTKEVKVKTCGKNISYYRGLGYNIPKLRSIITVKVKDLPKATKIKVDVQCPSCNKIRTIRYDTYTKERICLDCSSKATKNLNHRKGKYSNNWKGGVTSINGIIRKCIEYKTSRLDTYKRDKFMCTVCGRRSNKLNAHHLGSFAKIVRDNKITKENYLDYKDKLFNINNLITLCSDCHWDFHSKYGTLDNTKQQFEEYKELPARKDNTNAT